MKETKNVYVVGNDISYISFIKNAKIVSSISDADIVLFTGGEDVDPSLYGCEKHSSTYSNLSRDLYEKEIFEQVADNQLVIGVCRGSQFCCIMNGGKLIQDCSNHAIGYTHMIYEYETDKIYDITSTHHQMQYPFELPHAEILMASNSRLSRYYCGDGIDTNSIICEPEIVLYKKENCPKCLAIQGHPEMMSQEAPIVVRINEIIDELCK